MNVRLLRLLFLLGLVALGWHLIHRGESPPVLLTPAMDAQRLLHPSLGTRLTNLLHEAAGRRDAARPRLIALTFDDGPYPLLTPLLLARLRDEHVQATFFLIGRDVEQQPELTRRTLSEGFEVADHTLTHPYLDALPARDVAAELLGGSRVLAAYTHAASARHFMRPPHGRYTARTIQIAQSLGYTTVLWSDDPGDWRDITPDDLVKHVLTHATAPEILLLHSGRLGTILALDRLIPSFRAAGFEFVTVSELLRRETTASLNRPVRLTLSTPSSSL